MACDSELSGNEGTQQEELFLRPQYSFQTNDKHDLLSSPSGVWGQIADLQYSLSWFWGH